MTNDDDEFILELLGGAQLTPAPAEYSATAAPPTRHVAWNPPAVASSASDDLNGLDTWDFALMRSEFGDLQSYDSAALISLYGPGGGCAPEAVDDVDFSGGDDVNDEDEEAQRCRSDSGYSSACGGFAAPACGHHWWERGCGSPGLSTSSNDSLPSPAATGAAASTAHLDRRDRSLSAVVKKPMKKPRARLTKSRQMQLWQFLYHLLQQDESFHSDQEQQQQQQQLHPDRVPLRWESRHDGTFRIVNPTALADAWGAHRRRGNMTYEKMSRTLRYYYDRRLITKVAGKQHTYRFHYDQFPDL